ncbi:MAG: GGDEF domain-containing protein [Henriciella sp.]|nr:GGDEF domain-containing protein [Henriciella sp.]
MKKLLAYIGALFPKTQWVPDDGSLILSTEDIHRRRMIYVSLFAFAMTAGYTTLQVSQFTFTDSAIFNLVTGSVGCILSLVAIKVSLWRKRPVPYIRVLLMSFSALLWSEIYFAGGVTGYHIGILPLLPVVAAILLTARDTIMFTVLNVVVVAALAILALEGHYIPAFDISANANVLMTSMIIGISIIGCGGAAVMLVQQSEKVNRQLLELVEYQSHLAAHDHLTGLGNRISLQKRFESSEHNEAFDILLIDLDGFKAVNDTHGHNAGDFLIKAMADRLREVTDNQDLLVRLGGDEFVILLEDVDGTLGSVRKYAEYLIDIVSRPYRWNQAVLRVSASIGHARYPHHGANPSKVLSLADKALYAAKDAGKAQCITYGSETYLNLGRIETPRPQSSDSKRKVAAFTANLRQKSG